MVKKVTKKKKGGRKNKLKNALKSFHFKTMSLGFSG